MKISKRIIALLTVVLITVCSFTVTFAKKNNYDLYQDSIILIGSEVTFTSTNYNFEFTRTGSGTGFAVGNPGERVQYIATANHVVNEPEGVYEIVIDENGTFIDYSLQEEGTAYPDKKVYEHEGVTYTFYYDYFKTKPTELVAIFSNSSNDYVDITVAQSNSDADVAICKLASDPTDRLSPLPLQFKDTVEPNTDIVALGFPGFAQELNSELKLDGSDSTIKEGRIAKKQRSYTMFSDTAVDTYELTAQTPRGMSGGPVINEETDSVIAIVSFGVITNDGTNEQADYSICVDYLKPLLDAEGIKYKIAGQDEGIPTWVIIAIVAGIMVIAGVIVLIILLTRKKSVNYDDMADKQNYNYDQPNNYNENNDDYNEVSPAPEPQSHKYYLIGLQGYMAGNKFSITTRATIGRDKARCNVVYPVNQPGVSSLHCEIKLEGGVLIIKDCGSSYGTFLSNGTKLEPNVPMVLKSGTQFFVGAKENLFEVRY